MIPHDTRKNIPDTRTDDERAAWDAFYAHETYPTLTFKPGDWSAEEVMNGIRRVMRFMRGENVRPNATETPQDGG